MKYPLRTSCDFIRDHNVFLIKVDMNAYLLDYYVKRQESAGKITREQDAELKDLIACFAVHLTAGIGLEAHAWTVTRVASEAYSLFVTGAAGSIDSDNIARGYLVGNVLTENIRHSDVHSLHAQTSIRGKKTNSYVTTDSDSIVGIAERFFTQSEQRPIRIAISETTDTAVGIVALPDFDPEWFEKVPIEQFAVDADSLDSTRMRSCEFEFQCDCSPEKLLPYLKMLDAKEIDELYQEDDEILINCPRCGQNFVIPRAFLILA